MLKSIVNPAYALYDFIACGLWFEIPLNCLTLHEPIIKAERMLRLKSVFVSQGQYSASSTGYKFIGYFAFQ